MDPDEPYICPSSNNKLQEPCAYDAQWYYFVATSMGILFGGGFVISLLQLVYDKWNEISRKLFSNNYDRDKLDEVEFHNKLRHYIVNEVISLQTNKGMVLAILYFSFNVISVTLYINQSDQPLEQCVDVLNTCNWTLYADIGLNVFFLFHFLLRLIAAPNRLKFWFQMGSIVDFCTIPPCALALVLKRNWLGMRFMRALRFMQMGEILMTFNSTGTVVSFGGGGGSGGGGGGNVKRRTFNKPFSGAGQAGGPDSDVGRSYSRSSVDVRGGSKSSLKKAATDINDGRFTKVRDPVKNNADPRLLQKKSGTGKVKQKKTKSAGGSAPRPSRRKSTKAVDDDG